MTPLHTRARTYLSAPWLTDQPVAVQRDASELRHALHEPLTPETTRRLLDVLQAMDVRKMPVAAVEERDAIAREIVNGSPVYSMGDIRVTIGGVEIKPARAISWSDVPTYATGDDLRKAGIGTEMLEAAEESMRRSAAPIAAYPIVSPIEVKVGQRWRNKHGHAGTVSQFNPFLGAHLAMEGVVGLVCVDSEDLRREWTLVADAPYAVNAGEGWRLLARGENVEAGDEAHFGGKWYPVRAPIGAPGAIEDTFRRRVDVPQVGETWRDNAVGTVGMEYRVTGIDHAPNLDAGTSLTWVRLIWAGDSAANGFRATGFRVLASEMVKGKRWQRVTTNHKETR